MIKGIMLITIMGLFWCGNGIIFSYVARRSLDFIAIIQARHALSQGQLARAKASVRRLNDKNVELAELKLLEAEIALVEGDNNLAIDKLEGLLEDPTTSRWVRQVAEYILNESKSGE